MPSPFTSVVRVDTPPRGTTPQSYVEFRPSECVCTFSWGLQPATALIDWVSAQEQSAIIPQASLQIDVMGGVLNGGHTFYGICRSLVPVFASDGISQMQEFVDSREFLMWDIAYCAFNIRLDRIENGVFRKRYMHILPGNHSILRRTYTDAPYTAAQILDFLFSAPTTETPWLRVYHPFLDNPVYGLDYTSGRPLGAAIMEISERLGLTFTLQGGRYRLVWALKGVGAIPTFPANAENRRGPGLALSGNPTRVRLLGDRNLYQILNIDMQPDWKDAWQEFYDFNAFVRDIFLNESTEADLGTIAAGTRYNAIDPELENNAGYLLARARAQTITVAEYANLRDDRDESGDDYRDFRKFQGRSRLQMPVALYLGNVLFRAFRFPTNFLLRNAWGQLLTLDSLDLSDSAIVQVSHDPITGEMTYRTVVPSQSNGYAIVQGYQVAADAFKTLLPEHFNIDRWKDGQAVWQAASFHIDDSGEGNQFILFDEPIIRTNDLIDQVVISAVTQSYPALNRAAVVSVPAVRAALTFSAEYFSYVAGTGTKDGVENISGLNAQYVRYADGSGLVELEYADGLTGTQKAQQLAAPLLNRQFYYLSGGYVVQGCNGTQLTPVIDRVTVSLNSNGLSEEVDFTTERSRNVTIANGRAFLQVEPDRDFNRRAQLVPLLAGQPELREQANQLRAEAGFLLKHPRISRTIVDTFHLLMGLDAPPDVVMLQEGDGPVPVGAPIFRDASAHTPVMPSNGAPTTLADPVFMGVTVVNNEEADGPVRVTRMGNGGVILVRVRGPIALNGTLVIAAAGTTDYLEAGTTGAVAKALEAVVDGVTQLIRARVVGAAAGGGSGIRNTGEYSNSHQYQTDDLTFISTGDTAGAYLAIADPPIGTTPDTGAPYWITFPYPPPGVWQ